MQLAVVEDAPDGENARDAHEDVKVHEVVVLRLQQDRVTVDYSVVDNRVTNAISGDTTRKIVVV